MNAAGGPWPGFAMEQIMKTMNMVEYHYHRTIIYITSLSYNQNDDHVLLTVSLMVMKTMNIVGYHQLVAQLDREQSDIA